jgi:L-aminopeptidase/D-esterase-like protein
VPISNDTVSLEPRTSFDGRVLAFDFPGVRVGVAEYDEGPPGCTVIDFGRRVLSVADVRGGSPGTFMADAGGCHAICFAGGSLLGLEACAGVAAEIFARGGHRPGWENIPVVQGAIIFDMQGPNSVYPDKALGRAALRVAGEGSFPLGPRGAGRGARVGKGPSFNMGEPGGQGAAFGKFGETSVFVCTVVNAIGAIVDRTGEVVRGHRRPDGVRIRAEDTLRDAPETHGGGGPTRNTTLTALVTNQRLGPRELLQLARQVHASMARAIQPFHTVDDGDVLFAVSTYESVQMPLPLWELGVRASELAWDAVLSSFDSDEANAC